MWLCVYMHQKNHRSKRLDLFYCVCRLQNLLSDNTHHRTIIVIQLQPARRLRSRCAHSCSYPSVRRPFIPSIVGSSSFSTTSSTMCPLSFTHTNELTRTTQTHISPKWWTPRSPHQSLGHKSTTHSLGPLQCMFSRDPIHPNPTIQPSIHPSTQLSIQRYVDDLLSSSFPDETRPFT